VAREGEGRDGEGWRVGVGNPETNWNDGARGPGGPRMVLRFP